MLLLLLLWLKVPKNSCPCVRVRRVAEKTGASRCSSRVRVICSAEQIAACVCTRVTEERSCRLGLCISKDRWLLACWLGIAKGSGGGLLVLLLGIAKDVCAGSRRGGLVIGKRAEERHSLRNGNQYAPLRPTLFSIHRYHLRSCRRSRIQTSANSRVRPSTPGKRVQVLCVRTPQGDERQNKSEAFKVHVIRFVRWNRHDWPHYQYLRLEWKEANGKSCIEEHSFRRICNYI